MSPSTNTLEILDLGGQRFSLTTLIKLLPDVEVALFFAKLYDLQPAEVSTLLRRLFQSSEIIAALTSGGHSTSLQGYLTEIGDFVPDLVPGGVVQETAALPPLEEQVLANMFESACITIASSIKEVAQKTHGLLEAMPTQAAEMHFRTMKQFNAKTQSMGKFAPAFVRNNRLNNLVVLDVSGSMSEGTIRQIVADVVTLAQKASASLAIVSSTATVWQPGEYSTDAVLSAAEYASTCYEQLLPLFNQDWGEVVSIADYDSSRSVLDRFRVEARGSIQRLLDVSLVDQPTFLGECLSTIAVESEVKLIASQGMYF